MPVTISSIDYWLGALKTQSIVDRGATKIKYLPSDVHWYIVIGLLILWRVCVAASACYIRRFCCADQISQRLRSRWRSPSTICRPSCRCHRI